MDRSARFPLLLLLSMALHAWAVLALPSTRPARLSVQRGRFSVALRAVASPSSKPAVSRAREPQGASRVAAKPRFAEVQPPKPRQQKSTVTKATGIDSRMDRTVTTKAPAREAAAVDSGALEIPPAPWADNRAPAYPEQARRDGQQGVVTLRLQVLADGRVGRVATMTSSGYALLDEAARRAAARYRFEPARRAGKPVDDAVIVPFEFRLQRNRWVLSR